MLSSTLALLVASGAARSRADLVRATGLSRTTVSAQLDALLARGVISEGGEVAQASRGRPAHQLVIGPHAGVIAVADLGAHSARLAVCDLGQTPLAVEESGVDLDTGPARVLEALATSLDAMLARAEVPVGRLRAVVLGLPAPVDVRRGVAVRPPIMPGWDGFPVAETLRRRFGVDVLVDNDANLMALGEARALPPDQCPLLFIKVGEGIGGGLITADGRLHHGTDGAAGDIGHVRVPDASGESSCHCGSSGCVEAVASVRAITRRLSVALDPGGRTQVTRDELFSRLRRADPTAVALVREAAGTIGGVVATLVHFYNPSRVVIGGGITSASDHLLAGIRSVVYEHGLPLSTRNLTIAHSALLGRSGLAGGIVTGIEHALSPVGIHRLLST